MTRTRLLFVCTGNSARSQMAEGFARSYGQGKVEAWSAGMDPKGLNPFAVEVMQEKGIDISQQQSMPFSEALARSMHYVITVCGHAEERCPVLSPEVKRRHWPLDDPAQVDGSPEEIRKVFRRSRDEIDRRVRELLAEMEPSQA
jgi:arsenate reductase (thioredoxin)